MTFHTGSVKSKLLFVEIEFLEKKKFLYQIDGSVLLERFGILKKLVRKDNGNFRHI
tara:strand:- start:88 stop:255 length:168 start_codon:yes stop_codon:yes gene_type:complete